MSDNKANIGKQDRIRVSAKDPNEVEYVHRQFPSLTHEQVVAAIKRAGPLREEVMKYLGELTKNSE